MQNTIKGKTAGGIIKTARIVQMRAGNWEIVVDHPHQCCAMIGARNDGWGGQVSDVLVLTDADGVVARLQMSDAALAKMQRFETEREEKY